MKMQSTSVNPQFISPEPEVINSYPKILEERLNRTTELYRLNHLSYVLDSQNLTRQDTRERLNMQFISNVPKELVDYQLLNIVRLELPNDKRLPMFINSRNEYDSNVKSAIMATVVCSILDENSVKLGNPRVAGGDDTNNMGQYSCSYKLGRLMAPIVNLKYNANLTKIIDAELTGMRPVYYLPDTPETITMLEDTFGQPIKGYKTGVVAKHSADLIEVHKIPNRNEFIHGDLQMLNTAKRSNKVALTENEGGLVAYINYKKLEDQVIVEGITQQKLSQLTKEDVLEMLKIKQKEKNAKATARKNRPSTK